jgi:hypothetical protein
MDVILGFAQFVVPIVLVICAYFVGHKDGEKRGFMLGADKVIEAWEKADLKKGSHAKVK